MSKIILTGILLVLSFSSMATLDPLIICETEKIKKDLDYYAHLEMYNTSELKLVLNSKKGSIASCSFDVSDALYSKESHAPIMEFKIQKKSCVYSQPSFEKVIVVMEKGFFMIRNPEDKGAKYISHIHIMKGLQPQACAIKKMKIKNLLNELNQKKE